MSGAKVSQTWLYFFWGRAKATFELSRISSDAQTRHCDAQSTKEADAANLSLPSFAILHYSLDSWKRQTGRELVLDSLIYYPQTSQSSYTAGGVYRGPSHFELFSPAPSTRLALLPITHSRNMKVHTRHVTNLLRRDLDDVFPLFLCPALLRPSVHALPSPRRPFRNARPISSSVCRRIEVQSSLAAEFKSHAAQAALEAPTVLPLSCPGCGAPTQKLHPKEAGYYTTTRKTIVKHIRKAREEEEQVLETALKKIGKRTAQRLGVDAMNGILCFITLP
jgi:hypothetical protein